MPTDVAASPHLLLISLGPIQDFIRSARRCQDLWYGSYLLSELARACADSLEQSCGQEALIFPGGHGKAHAVGPGGAPAVVEKPAVANKLLVVVPAGKDVKEVAEDARAKMQEALEARMADAFDRVERPYFIREVAEAQVIELMELFWVAVPLESEASYEDARRRAESLLAARKNTRLWAQPNHSVAGASGGRVPKSALDGLRESVIHDDAYKLSPEKLRKAYHVKPAERLCGVGLLKRLGADPDYPGFAQDKRRRPPFHSTSHVASAPWRTRIAAQGEKGQKALSNFLNKAGELGVELKAFRVRDESVGQAANPLVPDASPVSTPARLSAPKSQAAGGFDGYLLYAERALDILERHPKETAEGDTKERATKLAAAADELTGKNGVGAKPGTYYAVLLADGDFMGAALDALKTMEKQRELSVALDGFARSCRSTVSRHCGSLVYAGGDDVLALVPLHTALVCARELHDAFSESLEAVLEGVQLECRPTLSVGLALCHHLTDMAEALELAREAERLAKRHVSADGREKDALAILADKRSGPRLSFVESWTKDPDKLLVTWAERLNADELPRGLVHELADVVAPLLVGSERADFEAPSQELVASLLTRVLLRKRPSNEAKKMAADLRKELSAVVDIKRPARSLREFSQMLQIAVMFLESYRVAFPEPTTREAEAAE